MIFNKYQLEILHPYLFHLLFADFYQNVLWLFLVCTVQQFVGSYALLFLNSEIVNIGGIHEDLNNQANRKNVNQQ